MLSDDLTWKILDKSFCSYKAITINQKFCRNKYNITGICNHTMCPLANSNYATILEEQGVLYLYVKVVERAHTPANLWEKMRLSDSFAEAIKQIDAELEFWPKILVARIKFRLTKITQYLIRVRQLARKPQPKLERINKKVERRERIREAKATKAANLEKAIEKELVERLKEGVYEGVYNFPTEKYEEALADLETEDVEEEEEREIVQEVDIEDAQDMFVEDFDIPAEKDNYDILPIDELDTETAPIISRKRRRKPKLELEEELEIPPPQKRAERN